MVYGVGGVGGNSPLSGSNSGPNKIESQLYEIAKNIMTYSSEGPSKKVETANLIQEMQRDLNYYSSSLSSSQQNICQNFCGASFEYCCNPCDETKKFRDDDFASLKTALHC